MSGLFKTVIVGGFAAVSLFAQDPNQAPPSNYPLRVKTMTFTPPAPDATGTIPSQGRARRPSGF